MKMRPADRILAALLGLTLLAGAVGAAGGLYMIGQDLEMSGEFLDGLGIMIGLVILGIVGAPMALAAKALHALWHQRPNAWKWATAAGLVGLVSGIPFGMFHHPLFAALVLPLLVAVVAVEGRQPAPMKSAGRYGAEPRR
jgi:hypothetical protein